MVGGKVSQIIDLAIDHDPAVIQARVLQHLLGGDFGRHGGEVGCRENKPRGSRNERLYRDYFQTCPIRR